MSFYAHDIYVETSEKLITSREPYVTENKHQIINKTFKFKNAILEIALWAKPI